MLARASQGSWEGLALAAGNKPTGRQAASELQFASPLPPKCSLSSALTLKGSSREGLQPSPHPRRGGELWLERSTSGTSQWAREARAQRSASSPGSSLPSWQSPQKPEPEPEPEPQPGCKYRLMDEEDSAPFTDIYWIQFAHVHNARFAKRKLDDFAFLGNELKVTYAPRDESVGDVRVKLEERRRTVLSKLEGPAGQKLLQQDTSQGGCQIAPPPSLRRRGTRRPHTFQRPHQRQHQHQHRHLLRARLLLLPLPPAR